MSVKQQAAMKKIVESRGKMPVSKAMLAVGYSPKSAKNPQNLTASKAWQKFMDSYLPDKKLLEAHQQGLEANRVISAVNTDKEATGGTTDFVEVPDHAVRFKFLELAYKLKKRLNPESQTLQQFTGDVLVTWGNGESA